MLSQREPSGQAVPPASSFRRAGSLNITSRCASSWRRHWHGACSPAIKAPAPARSCPRRLQAPRQLAGIRHASPSAALVWSLGGSGGRLAVARGQCPHAADGPQTLRATMTPAPFQSASRRSPSSPYVLKRRTAGLIMPHGGTPPTGHGPFGCPPQCGAQKQARRFLPKGYSTTRRSGCSSPTRSQARHIASLQFECFPVAPVQSMHNEFKVVSPLLLRVWATRVDRWLLPTPTSQADLRSSQMENGRHQPA